MPNFTVLNTTTVGGGQAQAAVTTTYKTQVIIFNSSTNANGNFTGAPSAFRRGKLYDLLVGTNGTPADNYMEWDVTRVVGGAATSTLGSISSISSNLGLDLADAAGAVNQIAMNSSVETDRTVLTQIFYVGVNQRASYRWVAAPGSELMWPGVSSASSANGVAGRTRSGGYTGTATMNVLFSE